MSLFGKFAMPIPGQAEHNQGTAFNKMFGTGVGKFLGTLEDPFQLHKSGLFYSPWTNMMNADDKAKEDEQAKGQAFYNSLFGNR